MSQAEGGDPGLSQWADAAQQLILANRILVLKGVLDAYGHVSLRNPNNPQTFLLSRSLAPAQVQAHDIIEYGLDSEPLHPGRPKGYLERFIHGELYRARSDVMAIVHSHSPSMVAFAAVPGSLKPIYHMGACVAGHAHLDLRDLRGESDLLIKDPEAGRYLASTLGGSQLVLMRGHGSTMVGSSIEEAVFNAVYAEINAGILINATTLGPVKTLSDGEAALCMKSQAPQTARAWGVWCAELARAGLA